MKKSLYILLISCFSLTIISCDAIKGQKTIAELASEYGVHANQISMWKKQLLDAAPAAFSSGKDKDA